MKMLRLGRLPVRLFGFLLGISSLMLSGLLLQGCGSSKDGQKAEAPTDYPDYQIPEDATDVPDDVERYTPKWYVERYKVYAIKEMKRTGIPASITLAQGMLESSYGKSRLARKGKNHFGIKCHRGDWGGGKMYLSDDRPDECFRTYQSVLHSYHDHSKFLVNGNRYQELFELKPNNYADWAEGLKEAGYATNPRYDDILIKLIKEHNLHYFDQFHNKPYKGQQLARQEKKSQSQKKDGQKQNGLKAFIPDKQQPLSRIAEKTGAPVSKLKEYNDFNDPYATVQKGTPLYLEPKKAKPARSYHVVEEGESLWEVAQQYGVKLRYLYKRNRLTPPDQPPVGERVFLRKVRYKAMKTRKNPLPKPNRGKADKASGKNSDDAHSASNRPSFHAVQKGETMQEIAKRYDMALPKLYKLNRLKRGQQPAVGAELHLKETRYIRPDIRHTKTSTQEQTKSSKAEKEPGTTDKNPESPAATEEDQRSFEKEAKQQAREDHKKASSGKPAKREEKQEVPSAGKASSSEWKTHTVRMGQTLYAISRKFGVSVKELKKWNNLQKSNLKKGQELRVKPPQSATDNQGAGEKSPNKSGPPELPAYHTVKQGETLFGITQAYDLSMEVLRERNNLSSSQLEPGQKLRIRPKSNRDKAAEADGETQPETPEKKGTDESNSQALPAYHTVKQGETLFGIAQAYDLSMETLRERNELSSSQLKPGQKLRIQPESNKDKAATSGGETQQKTHTVKSGETLFGIAQSYGVSVEALKTANDLEGNTLQQGQELIIP